MKTKKEFYNEIYGAIKEALEKLHDLSEQLEAAKAKSRSNKYSRQYLESNIFPQINKLERQIRDYREDTKRRAWATCDEYTAELRAADDLDPSKITDDIKLLQAGIPLTQRDLRAMIARNESNSTMLQLTLRYAEEHKIDTGSYYVGNRGTIADVEATKYSVDSALKLENSPNLFERLLGEGSPIYEAFCGDGE